MELIELLKRPLYGVPLLKSAQELSPKKTIRAQTRNFVQPDIQVLVVPHAFSLHECVVRFMYTYTLHVYMCLLSVWLVTDKLSQKQNTHSRRFSHTHTHTQKNGLVNCVQTTKESSGRCFASLKLQHSTSFN